MNGFLLDTNVISEARRRRAEPRVAEFFRSCRPDELFLSTVTIAEIRFGIQLLADPVRRQDLLDWLEQSVRPQFEGRILEVTEDVLLRWRLMVEQGRKTGRTYSQPDSLIAAIARHHDLALVTRNVADFSGLSVDLINPWNSKD